jgi:hypothetical protein
MSAARSLIPLDPSVGRGRVRADHPVAAVPDPSAYSLVAASLLTTTRNDDERQRDDDPLGHYEKGSRIIVRWLLHGLTVELRLSHTRYSDMKPGQC